MNIPFQHLKSSIAEIRPEIDAAISRVLDSGWLLLGKELESFEHEWALYCQAKFAIGVSNGLDAMHLILRAWGIGAGDEVIVPSNTYIATWLAVSQVGAIPIPVEPSERTYNLDPEKIEKKIGPRTKAILAVHLYGHSCDMDAITRIGKRHGLHIIEDAAQAHGTKFNGRPIGSHGDAVAWSFYPTKNLGALGDGGAITTNDGDLAEKLRILRNYGSKVRYVNEVAGYNNRLEEIHAAVLRVKLAHLDRWNAIRLAQADRYIEALRNTKLILPSNLPWSTHSWHLFTVRHPDRDRIRSELEKMGIGTLIHYPIPPHLQKAYAHLGYREGDFPISEAIHRSIFSLPLGPNLRSDEQAYIIDKLTSILK